MPLASVVSVSVAVPFVNLPLAPIAGAVNVTDAPLTGYWLLSTTVATSGAANAVLMVASCRDPLVAEMDAGGPDVFIRLKLVVAVTPATEAVTVLAPSVPLAVYAVEMATPLALVVSVSVLVPPANVPLAPVAGAVKVTKAPLTGDPPIVTVAINGAKNAVLTAVLCGVPLVGAINSAGGLKFELLQLVKKTKARKTKPRMLTYAWRFIASRLSGQCSGEHVPGAIRALRAGCGWCRPRRPLSRCAP